MIRFLFPLALLACASFARADLSTPPPASDLSPEALNKPVVVAPSTSTELSASSFVRVNSTNQRYNLTRPWVKRDAYSRRGIGTVITGGDVLVTAELVTDHTYVELERASDSAKTPAEVRLVDYEANLALLRPVDPGFLSESNPVDLAPPLTVGDELVIAQLERNGAVAVTGGRLTTVTVSNYPVDGIFLLSYAVSAPLQYRDNSFTVPIFHGKDLAGLLMRYDSRSQTATVLPSPLIRTFLERAATSPYQSFPRAGLAFASTRDPQFRRFLGMEETDAGIYVSELLHGSASDESGLQKGDVVLAVDGYDLDDDGNYDDDDFGKISFGHLISNAEPGRTSLPLTILRDSQRTEITLPLKPRDPATVISEAFTADEAPPYLVLGGVVFQELSRPYLEEWGSEWRSNAPQRLVYLDAFQNELPADRGKIVFVSQVLPSDATLGYEDLGSIVVDKVNGQEIKSLADVAAALEQPSEGFHKIEFDSDPGVIFLDPEQIDEQAERLQQAYGLPQLRNLE